MTIRLGFSLPYGWSKSRPVKWFSSYYHRKISENKSFEWQTDYMGWTSLLDVHLDLIPTGSDHAGMGFSITVLGFMVDAKIYDSRHWDHDANTWEKYKEEPVRDYYAEQVKDAYRLIARHEEAQAKEAHAAYLATPEGQASLALEAERVREEKRLRGLEYKARNLAAKDDKE